jgi:flagellar motility protein MotE (MotC chaperone)
MKRGIPSPRLLPVTIVALGALLAMKSVALVRAAVPAGQLQGMLIASAESQPSKPAAAEAVRKATPPTAPPAPTTPAPVAPAAAAPPEPPPVSDSEKAILLELRQRRKQLDSREGAVAARESMLTAAEQKISSRVNELQALQHQLETLETVRRQREDAGWQGLVKLYEAMKPRDAAAIFNELAMPTLLQIVDRMNDRRAALVMAAMNPDRARDVTAQLAQMRLRRETTAAGQDGRENPAPAKSAPTLAPPMLAQPGG